MRIMPAVLGPGAREVFSFAAVVRLLQNSTRNIMVRRVKLHSSKLISPVLPSSAFFFFVHLILKGYLTAPRGEAPAGLGEAAGESDYQERKKEKKKSRCDAELDLTS